MRIALLTPAWPGSMTANGIATTVVHLRDGLEACGHEVTIIALQIDAPHDDCRVIEVPSVRWTLLDKIRWRLGDDAVPYRVTAKQVLLAVQEAERSIGVEVFVMEETQGWARWLCGKVSIPVVVTLHCPRALDSSLAADVRREAREAAALRVVQGVTAPSRDALDATRRIYGLSKVPLAVVPNPVPTQPEAKELSVDRAQLRKLLFVGRYDVTKGGDTVIEMFRRLAALESDCTLSFIGPDWGIFLPDGKMQGIDAHIATLPEGFRKRVTVLGQRSKAEIAALRQRHGITVIASRYETFGYVMAEAMAIGSPIVCTQVGGPAEILKHEETALLVPPEDPEALADACKRLIDDPALAIRLGHAAHDYATRHLSPAVVGRQMADFLECVVNSFSKR